VQFAVCCNGRAHCTITTPEPSRGRSAKARRKGNSSAWQPNAVEVQLWPGKYAGTMGSSSNERVFERRHLSATCPVVTKYSALDSRLDVGCGPGSMTLDIARLVLPGRVTGVDITLGRN